MFMILRNPHVSSQGNEGKGRRSPPTDPYTYKMKSCMAGVFTLPIEITSGQLA